jgi:hypothetical protein
MTRDEAREQALNLAAERHPYWNGDMLETVRAALDAYEEALIAMADESHAIAKATGNRIMLGMTNAVLAVFSALRSPASEKKG